MTENQFRFMPERSTIEVIHLLRKLIEKYRKQKQDLHMVFIDLEKTYDRVPREIIWRILEKRGVSVTYIELIKDIYEDVTTRVKTSGGVTEAFPIKIGLHQGSALSPYLFTLIMDELTAHIQDTVPWCMLFADDIILVDETREGVNAKLESWRETLEGKGFKLSRLKTEYMQFKFSNIRSNETIVKIGEDELPGTERFKYLGSFLQNDGGIERDVLHKIQAG